MAKTYFTKCSLSMHRPIQYLLVASLQVSLLFVLTLSFSLPHTSYSPQFLSTLLFLSLFIPYFHLHLFFISAFLPLFLIPLLLPIFLLIQPFLITHLLLIPRLPPGFLILPPLVIFFLLLIFLLLLLAVVLLPHLFSSYYLHSNPLCY